MTMNRVGVLLTLVLLANPAYSQGQPASQTSRSPRVNIAEVLDSLLHDEDTDDDKRITVDDPHLTGTTRGDKRFSMKTPEGTTYEINGTYHLSNLLQELKLAAMKGDTITVISFERIVEKPVNRLSRSIREQFWDGLTRRIDEQGLPPLLSDTKYQSPDGYSYLYTSSEDTLSLGYFRAVSTRHADWRLRVEPLPGSSGSPTARFAGPHGLLALAIEPDPAGRYRGVPFVVPGGRFNEMYGWDSYFIVLGLLADGRVDLAKSMVDNMVFEINHYGAILNANRTYYLTRSQPPFLTSMVLAVHRRLTRTSTTKEWLRRALDAAITEYHNVWMNPQRLTGTGLSRYHDSGSGIPPEVEAGHFDVVFREFARKLGRDPKELEASYRSGQLTIPELDAYFVHDRSMRESGHDTSYRLEGVSADLVTVDLNSLLFKIETDIANTITKEFEGSFTLSDGTMVRSREWRDRAAHRKQLITKYLWNEKQGMFFDYDFARGEKSGYVSATTLYPLWAGLATPEQAKSLVTRALPLLEMPGGLAGSTERSRGMLTADRPQRQWDFPYGWAPHQVLAWHGLVKYGYTAIARRLAYRWLYTIVINAVNYNGTVPEKFDVVKRSHQVFAEYGNVGTSFSYITREGFGWTNASFEVGRMLLSIPLLEGLNSLIAPEWVFPD